MKILLINPGFPGGNKKKGLFPPLNLAMVAAHTPKAHQVEIVDEHVADLPANPEADLIGITVMTSFAPRAYTLADSFREKGIPVVLGGMHPSALPEEALAHADAVVLGEVESVWPGLLADAEKGRLKGIYRAERYPELSTLPFPRRELWRSQDYLLPYTVQTSRGCPFRCSFCAVSKFFGRTYRFRPIPEIIREVKSLPGRVILFVDDNIIGDTRYAKELFRELIPLKKQWISQGSINMAQDEELLRLAAKSGCLGMFIGLESVSNENLEQIKKKVNMVNIKEAIAKIRRFGIGIEGAFIFGFDHDQEDVFQKTMDFVEEARLEGAQFGVLTPFPGTDLFREMEAAKRIIERDWSKYTVNRVVFKPQQMSAQRLQEGLDWAWRNFFSYRSIFKRLGIFRKNLGLIWLFNLVSRDRVYNYLRQSKKNMAWV